jgi:uncharacterized YigZ family protein
MSTDSYLGISKTYFADYKQSNSKFIGILFPVENNVAFEKKIKELKQEYADATHVCSACVIGIIRDYQKFSDDGEPNNSAGRPILNALLSANLSFVGCAVVRYYGGKKLGVPGLIEAYGNSAQLAINSAKIKTLLLMDFLKCTIAPENSYLLYNLIHQNSSFEMEVENDIYIIAFPKSMTLDLLTELKNIDTLAVLNEK